MKEYIRNCPKCNEVLTYKSKKTFHFANNKNSICRSCSNSGKNNPFYGKKHTQTHIEYMKQISSNENYIESRKTVSEKLKGVPKTKLHIKKLSIASKKWYQYNDNPMKGKTHSDEVKELLKLKSINQWNEYRKTDEYKEWLDNKPEYELYYMKVMEITNTNDLSKLKNWSKRNKYHKYELDHIYPISKGFKNNIPAELIGNVANLRIIPQSENRSKNDKITIIPEHIKKWQEEHLV